MTGRGRDAVIVKRTVANERERLRFLTPLHRFHIEKPDVPVGADKVGSVWIQVLYREGANFRRAVALIAEVPLGDGDLRRTDGLDAQLGERALGSGQRRGREQARKFRDHGGFREVAGPDAEIGSVGHFAYSIIAGPWRRGELRRDLECGGLVYPEPRRAAAFTPIAG